MGIHLRDEGGSSLVELMIATLFAIIVLGAVLTIVTRQSTQRQAIQETSLALSAAINSLERIRTVPAGTLPTLDGAGFDVPGSNGKPGGLEPLPNDGDGLPGQIRVGVDQASAGATLYRVSAVVTWRGVQRRRTVRLESLVTERK